MNTMSTLLPLWRQVGLPLLFCLLQLVHGGAGAESLSAQLEWMAEQEGFILTGKEKLSDQPAVKVEGDPTVRLGSLLSGINHVLIKSPSGGIERVVILTRGKELPPPPSDQIVVNTRRKGSHHLVSATLTGEHGKALQAELMVDTGASFVVLPDSMIPLLGIEQGALEERELQTAKGGVRARIGVLTALTLADRQINEVTVAFIADSFLGDNPLLGMSVLGRFRVTLDDAGNRLVLVSQDLE
jgi:clan AA aspartic protease (TIGR02281 family)